MTPPPAPESPPAFNWQRLFPRAGRAIWGRWWLWLLAALGVWLGGLHGIDTGLSPLNILGQELLLPGATTNRDQLLDLLTTVNETVLTFTDPTTGQAPTASPTFWYVAVSLFLGVGLLMLFAGSVVESALIAAIHHHQTGSPPSPRPVLRLGLQRAWPVFLIRLIIGVSYAVPLAFGTLALFGLLLASMTALAGVDTLTTAFSATDLLRLTGLLLLCIVPIAILFVLVSILFAWLEILALRAAVIDGLNWWPAIRAAWRLLRAQWRRFVPFWLLVVVARYLAGLLLGAPLQALAGWLVFGPFDLAALVLGTGMPVLNWAVVLLSAPLIGLIGLLAGGGLHLYVSSLWTLTYLELDQTTTTA